MKPRTPADWHAVKWHCMSLLFSFILFFFLVCFLLLSFAARSLSADRNYESITLSISRHGALHCYVHMDFMWVMWPLHPPSMCPVRVCSACCLKHWVLCTEVDKSSSLLPPHTFRVVVFCFVLFFNVVLLSFWPRDTKRCCYWEHGWKNFSRQNSREVGRKGGAMKSWEVAVSWTKIVPKHSCLHVFGSLPWVHDHQKSCSYVILQDFKSNVVQIFSGLVKKCT